MLMRGQKKEGEKDLLTGREGRRVSRGKDVKQREGEDLGHRWRVNVKRRCKEKIRIKVEGNNE